MSVVKQASLQKQNFAPRQAPAQMQNYAAEQTPIRQSNAPEQAPVQQSYAPEQAPVQQSYAPDEISVQMQNLDENPHIEAEPVKRLRGVYKIKAKKVKLAKPEGLLEYKKWWFRREVSVGVGGQTICGTPIFATDDAIRLVNDEYSYFIPICKLDYIRTNDGLGKMF